MNLLTEIEKGTRSAAMKKKIIGYYLYNQSSTLPDLAKELNIYNPQIEMFARFKMKSSFHKTKRII